MKLNVEISAKTNWNDDKLRILLKHDIINAIDDAVNSIAYAELNSLKFSVPTAKRRKKTS